MTGTLISAVLRHRWKITATVLLMLSGGCAGDRARERPRAATRARAESASRSPAGPPPGRAPSPAPAPVAESTIAETTTQTGPATPAAWTEALSLQHASHDSGGAPSVVAHAPADFHADEPLQLVIFLHGWDCCATSIMEDVPCRADEPPRGWSVAALHDEAGTDSLLVVPQLAYLQRSGDPGRFAERGFFRGFVRELLGDALAGVLGGPRRLREIGSVTLVAHSAGYRTAMAILDKGGLRVDHVVLLDALYRGVPVFVRWVTAARGRKLVSLHSDVRWTTEHNRVLAFELTHRLGPSRVAVDPHGRLREAIRRHVAVIKHTPYGHAGVIEHRLADVLAGLDLRPRGPQPSER